MVRVWKRKHLPAWIHCRVKMIDNGLEERLGKVVERGPQEDYVEVAPGKVQRVIEESPHIPDRIVLLVLARLPVAGAGVVDQIGKKNAVAKAR